jgi:hypothetical protein
MYQRDYLAFGRHREERASRNDTQVQENTGGNRPREMGLPRRQGAVFVIAIKSGNVIRVRGNFAPPRAFGIIFSVDKEQSFL